jgi:type I restriction enzyme S subunit
MAMSQSCYALIGKGYVSQYFLFCAVRESIEQLRQHAVGAVFDAVVVDTFRHLPFVIPDWASIQRFEQVVEPLFALLQNITWQNRNLQTARDVLVPLIIGGDILTSADPGDLGGPRV